MGDTSVDFFLETMQQLITSSKLDSIIEEKHQLQSLEEEIKYLRGFLKISEKKRNDHSEVMKLVMKIRDLVSEAENIVEEFVIDAFQSIRTLSFTTKKKNLSLELESAKKKIKTLTTRVKQIYDENIYDINGVVVKKFKHSSTRSGGSSSSAEGSNTSKVVKEKVVVKVVKEKVVVGFDKEVERLIEMLDYKGEGKPLEIITIIGAGGGGKTTLAREVYDHPFTLYTFEIRAWVDVSQDYDKTTMKRDLLIRVLKSAFPQNQEDYENISEVVVGEMVHKSLKGSKYLIVMDDIWGMEAWNDIQRSFPKERNGSKVLFTSRQLIQLDSVHLVPHYLDPLPKHKSWELLQKKVFGMKCCPPELVNIGVKIAEKCEGLPLAIVAIAGILAKEDKTLDTWKEVAKHLSSNIAENKEAGCMEILELSYNYLPLHLKACFLYIGAFIEDSEIRVRELLWLWIAEGFIHQSEEGKSLEAIARDHLIDLIDRSLIMVARKSSLGGIKACRIHDLLRVFCLRKAEEDKFFVQIYEGDLFPASMTDKHRRLFIGHNEFFRNFQELFLRRRTRKQFRNIQSFLCLHSPNSSYSVYEQDLLFFQTFDRLRVFSFVSAVCRREVGIGNLVHLRYVAVRLPRQERFIASPLISNLSNLQTLDLQGLGYSKFIQLPLDIFKMVKLRHLYSKYGIFAYHFSSAAARISFDHSSKLDSLQTLHTICGCKYCRSFLVRTPNLMKLGLKVKISVLLPDLDFLKCLETLNLALFTLTAELKLPLTLKRLTLSWTILKWEEVSILQNLPSLEVLKFKGDACVGQVWNTSEEGFSQLKYLSLYHMYQIKEWNASEDQFPRLEVLVIEGCTNLKQIPIDFADLNELREIKLIHCTRSANECARKIQEEQKNRKGDDDCPNLIVKPNFLGNSSDESE